MRPDLWVKPKENDKDVASIPVFNHKTFATLAFLKQLKKMYIVGPGLKLKTTMVATNWEKENPPSNL